jgi:hypothetical protein
MYSQNCKVVLFLVIFRTQQGRRDFCLSFVFFGKSKGFRLRKPLLEQNMRGCVLGACGKHMTTPLKKNEKNETAKIMTDR